MKETMIMIAYKALITRHSETTKESGTPREQTIRAGFMLLSP